MLDIDSWITLYENNEAAFIIFALSILMGVIGYFLKRLIEKRDNPTSPTKSGPQGGANQTVDNINVANNTAPVTIEIKPTSIKKNIKI